MPNAPSSKSPTASHAAKNRNPRRARYGIYRPARLKPSDEWTEIDSSTVDTPRKIRMHNSPPPTRIWTPHSPRLRAKTAPKATRQRNNRSNCWTKAERVAKRDHERLHSVIAFPRTSGGARSRAVRARPRVAPRIQPWQRRALYSNMANATSGSTFNPSPLTTEEMDFVYGLPYAQIRTCRTATPKSPRGK